MGDVAEAGAVEEGGERVQVMQGLAAARAEHAVRVEGRERERSEREHGVVVWRPTGRMKVLFLVVVLRRIESLLLRG
eukprot:1120384-Rhodomonas_salina.1